MLKKLQQLIQSHFSEQEENDVIHLEGLTESQSLSLILMLEIALADGSFSDDERQFILADLQQDYALDNAIAEAALRKAHEEVRNASSLQHFTAPLKELPYPQKVALLENLWRLAYADNTLDPHEESMLRKLADLLYIAHADYIKAKLKVSE